MAKRRIRRRYHQGRLKGEKAFQFQPSEDQQFVVTKAFWGAKVQGKVRKAPIDNKGRITIRLQGIDAPELHYAATSPKGTTEEQKELFREFNEKYRQHFGQTAAVKLYEFLEKLGGSNGEIPCTVTTMVDKPGDVFDTYCRFIGDVWVTVKSKNRSINQWLVEEGLAFPTFYNTMTQDEIETLISLTKKGKRKKNSIWQNYKELLGKLDEGLIYSKNDGFDPSEDEGPLILPKLFRRLVTWTTCKKAGIYDGTFKSYLAKSKDSFYQTNDFIENGIYAATPHFLPDFIEGGRFGLEPQEMVFKEEPSTVVDSKGKKITAW